MICPMSSTSTDGVYVNVRLLDVDGARKNGGTCWRSSACAPFGPPTAVRNPPTDYRYSAIIIGILITSMVFRKRDPVDISNPLRSISPTVDADVIRVLVGTHGPLTGLRVAELARRSYAQVRSVLHRLVDEGVVDAEQHGRTFSYRWNRDHVMADAVEVIAHAVDSTEQRITEHIADWNPAPRALVVFGSFARRDGATDSDIDMLLVRSDDIDEDDERWTRLRHTLARRVERWTGNPAQILELSATELSAAVRRGEDLVEPLRQDGRVLFGPKLAELVGSGGLER